MLDVCVTTEPEEEGELELEVVSDTYLEQADLEECHFGSRIADSV